MPRKSNRDKEVERRLFAKAQSGDVAARNELMLRYEKFVGYVAKKMKWLRVPREDLFQEGMIGLERAIMGFDAYRGFAFTSYAYRSIKHDMVSGAAQITGVAYLPENAMSHAVAVASRMRDGEDFESAFNSANVPSVYFNYLPDVIRAMREDVDRSPSRRVLDRTPEPLDAMVQDEDAVALMRKVNEIVSEEMRDLIFEAPLKGECHNPWNFGTAKYGELEKKYGLTRYQLARRVSIARKVLTKAIGGAA